jgi:hypothetical protein
MYCPSCGKSDQNGNSYCRQCGEFLADPKQTGFGGITPRQNINSITILGAIGAIVSLLTALLMYYTRFSIPIVLFIAAAVLLCNTAWHIANIYTARKLASRITRKGAAEGPAALSDPATRDLLNPADMSDHIRASVTEKTTRNLVT